MANSTFRPIYDSLVEKISKDAFNVPVDDTDPNSETYTDILIEMRDSITGTSTKDKCPLGTEETFTVFIDKVESLIPILDKGENSTTKQKALINSISNLVIDAVNMSNGDDINNITEVATNFIVTIPETKVKLSRICAIVVGLADIADSYVGFINWLYEIDEIAKSQSIYKDYNKITSQKLIIKNITNIDSYNYTGVNPDKLETSIQLSKLICNAIFGRAIFDSNENIVSTIVNGEYLKQEDPNYISLNRLTPTEYLTYRNDPQKPEYKFIYDAGVVQGQEVDQHIAKVNLALIQYSIDSLLDILLTSGICRNSNGTILAYDNETDCINDDPTNTWTIEYEAPDLSGREPAYYTADSRIAMYNLDTVFGDVVDRLDTGKNYIRTSLPYANDATGTKIVIDASNQYEIFGLDDDGDLHSNSVGDHFNISLSSKSLNELETSLADSANDGVITLSEMPALYKSQKEYFNKKEEIKSKRAIVRADYDNILNAIKNSTVDPSEYFDYDINNNVYVIPVSIDSVYAGLDDTIGTDGTYGWLIANYKSWQADNSHVFFPKTLDGVNDTTGGEYTYIYNVNSLETLFQEVETHLLFMTRAISSMEKLISAENLRIQSLSDSLDTLSLSQSVPSYSIRGDASGKVNYFYSFNQPTKEVTYQVEESDILNSFHGNVWYDRTSGVAKMFLRLGDTPGAYTYQWVNDGITVDDTNENVVIGGAYTIEVNKLNFNNFDENTTTYVTNDSTEPSNSWTEYEKYINIGDIWLNKQVPSLTVRKVYTLNGGVFSWELDTPEKTYKTTTDPSLDWLVEQKQASINSVWIDTNTIPNIKSIYDGTQWVIEKVYATYIQSSTPDPSIVWNDKAKEANVGSIWIDSDTPTIKKVYYYNGTNYEWLDI